MGMVYSRGTPGDGVWHCPFTKEWVALMKRAAKHCEMLSAEYVELTLSSEWMLYRLPPGDFLSEAQDARGLPLSWCRREERKFGHVPECCTAIYDYDSLPDVVVSNGEEDWPLRLLGRVLTA